MKKPKRLLVGFRDESELVRAVARRLNLRPVFATQKTYRGGEMSVTESVHSPSHAIVAANVTEQPDSLFRVLLLAHALRSNGASVVELFAPWIAYGRQDRSTKKGEAPAGVVLATLLSHAFDRITTLDAHSPEFIRAFRGTLVNVFPPLPKNIAIPDVVVAPDRGATVRAKRIAQLLHVPCLIVQKKRVGKDIESRLSASSSVVDGASALLVDDIADSGGTLHAAACALRAAGIGSVSAFVTHAPDLASLRRRLGSSVSPIFATFDHARNAIDLHAIAAMLQSGLAVTAALSTARHR